MAKFIPSSILHHALTSLPRIQLVLLPTSICPALERNWFSTTASLCARHPPHKKRRDGNPNRGVSALRRTGLRFPVGMSKEPLPRPVLDPKRRSRPQGDPNHGLWGFFGREKKSLSTPKEEFSHGMACVSIGGVIGR